MRILVTNDDGIHGPGLEIAEAIARQLSDDVWVIAPETDQSGVSHSLSLQDPLRLRQIGDKRMAVKGTPTDCVIMAVRHVMKDTPPDLVLSGVNRGQNAADDVTYSGTVAAAMEGTVLGIPSIALSQAYGRRDEVPWDCGRAHGAGVIRRILEAGIGEGTLVNVNFPACAPDEVKGVAAVSQGERDQGVLDIDARTDGRGNPYFWIAIRRGSEGREPGTDLAALADLRIAVTPLRLDLTDNPTLTRYAQHFGQRP